jgi:hypothetical protein
MCRSNFSCPQYLLEASAELHAPVALPSEMESSVSKEWAPEPVWTTWRREKSHPYQESNHDPLAVQIVASRYTDWAVPVPCSTSEYIKFCYFFLDLLLWFRKSLNAVFNVNEESHVIHIWLWLSSLRPILSHPRSKKIVLRSQFLKSLSMKGYCLKQEVEQYFVLHFDTCLDFFSTLKAYPAHSPKCR